MERVQRKKLDELAGYAFESAAKELQGKGTDKVGPTAIELVSLLKDGGIAELINGLNEALMGRCDNSKCDLCDANFAWLPNTPVPNLEKAEALAAKLPFYRN